MRVHALRMVLAFGLALAGAGCADERPPTRPGGGGGGGGGGGDGDGDPIDDDGIPRVRGTICRIADLRFPASCSALSRAGYRVAERGTQNQSISDAQGAFAVPTQRTGSTTLLVSFPGIPAHQPSVIPVTLVDGAASGVSGLIVSRDDWNDLTTGSGVVEPDGSGAVAIYVRSGESAVAGAEIIPSADVPFAPLYDTGNRTVWQPEIDTGPAGAALLFGVPADPAGAPLPRTTDFTVVGPVGFQTVDVTGVPVAEGSTTFVFVTLPAAGN